MNQRAESRREFLAAMGAATGAAVAAGAAGRVTEVGAVGRAKGAAPVRRRDIDEEFFIKPEELTLNFAYPPGERALSFAHFEGEPEDWRTACRAKLAELIGYKAPTKGRAKMIRATEHEGVRIEAWVMRLDETVSLPAYLLRPLGGAERGAVMAIHGHGFAEPCCGLHDDYHHMFALRLAQAGHTVLCPELRGFGALGDMAASDPGRTLDYWVSSRGHQFTLVTDAFLFGKTVIGQTIEDLVRWEDWLAEAHGVDRLDAAGISYGGDLSIIYPAFSRRVRRVYCSGSMGSFSGIFARCYNAPAHCVPGVLRWMDRSDIAGLSAPRPVRLHYGELDTPGPDNASAAYNETVEPALAELRTIYAAFSPEDAVSTRVTPDAWHEFEIEDLLAFVRV